VNSERGVPAATSDDGSDSKKSTILRGIAEEPRSGRLSIKKSVVLVEVVAGGEAEVRWEKSGERGSEVRWKKCGERRGEVKCSRRSDGKWSQVRADVW
jgi:hypothetical protein